MTAKRFSLLLAPFVLAAGCLGGASTTSDTSGVPEEGPVLTDIVTANGWTIPNEYTASDTLQWPAGLHHLYVLTMRNDTAMGVTPARHGFYGWLIGDGNINKVWWVSNAQADHWYGDVQALLDHVNEAAQASLLSMSTSGLGSGLGHPGPSPGGGDPLTGGYVFSPAFRGFVFDVGQTEYNIYQRLNSADEKAPMGMENQWENTASMRTTVPIGATVPGGATTFTPVGGG